MCFDLVQLIRRIVSVADCTISRIAAIRRHFDEIAVVVKAVIPRRRFYIHFGSGKPTGDVVGIGEDPRGSDRLLTPRHVADGIVVVTETYADRPLRLRYCICGD